MSDGDKRRGFFASSANLILLGFLAIGGFYLIAEHSAHLLGAAPLLLLLVFCVGMHSFMHGGHHGQGADEGQGATDDEGPSRHRH